MSVHNVTWEQAQEWWRRMHEHVTYDVSVDYGAGAVTFLTAERWRVRPDGTLIADDDVGRAALWARFRKRQTRRTRMARKRRRGWA